MPPLDTSSVDDEKFYNVILSKPIEITKDNYANPGSAVRLRGDLVKVHAEGIIEATEATGG